MARTLRIGFLGAVYDKSSRGNVSHPIFGQSGFVEEVVSDAQEVISEFIIQKLVSNTLLV